MYDMRNPTHSTLDKYELGTRIRYYVLTNGKRVHMIKNINLFFLLYNGYQQNQFYRIMAFN